MWGALLAVPPWATHIYASGPHLALNEHASCVGSVEMTQAPMKHPQDGHKSLLGSISRAPASMELCTHPEPGAGQSWRLEHLRDGRPAGPLSLSCGRGPPGSGQN